SRAPQATRRAQRGAGSVRPRARHRLPAHRELRRAQAGDDRGRAEIARPGWTRATPPLWRAVRRVQHLLSAAAEARSGGADAGAVGAEARGRAWLVARHSAPTAAGRVDVGTGRDRRPGGVLQGVRLSRMRPARRADRYPGAAGGPDPAVAGLASEPGESISGPAERVDRRRRLRGDPGNDVDSWLLAGGAGRCLHQPRLPA